MAIDHERFGSDLRLLDNLEEQNSRDHGRDLVTRVRPETGGVDLNRTEGVDNLQQALLLRFLTPVGDLAILGHPDYGSRLHELIGEPNTETNRNRAKLYTLTALQAEPRVKEIKSVTVTTRRSEPSRIDIDISLLAIDDDSILNLVFPFFFEGASA